MNIVTYFDYNNHIVFISTHTKIGTQHEKAPVSQVLAIKAMEMGQEIAGR